MQNTIIIIIIMESMQTMDYRISRESIANDDTNNIHYTKLLIVKLYMSPDIKNNVVEKDELPDAPMER